MATVPPPAVRLAHVLAAAGLEPEPPPRRIVSHSNDVWSLDDARLGPVVLRVSWRGAVARIGREVAVAERMSAAVRYPDVVRHGLVTVDGVDLGYSLTRRIEGQPARPRLANTVHDAAPRCPSWARCTAYRVGSILKHVPTDARIATRYAHYM